MNKFSAVIVDDEYFNRKLISMLIDKINPAFSVEGEAENMRDGLKIISQLKPNVVFLDIKMPDGSGFDLLKQIDNINFEVVFITGFDQYALQAFEFNALDYVLKPIDVDKFKLTLEKVESRLLSKQGHSERLKQIAESYHSEEGVIARIPIHFNNKVVLLGLDQVMYVTATEKGTIFTQHPSETFVSNKPLVDFEFILDTYRPYVRVNKNMYINVNYISSYTKGFEPQLTMRDGTVLEVSGTKKTEIVDLLKRKMAGPAKS